MTEAAVGIRVFEHDLPDELAAAVRAAGVAAWDTETSGLDPRVDRLHLCQIFAPSIGALLVRVDDRRPDRLCELLSDPDVLKVMHHAPFDLAFMRASWGVDARAVRCTKIASKLVAPGAPATTHSLAAQVRSRLGIELNKGAVRTSDWGAEELSSQQIRYASEDVVHLLDLYQLLVGELDAQGLAALFTKCCEFLSTRTVVAALGIDDVFAY
ncbi:hypothetical protein [Luteimicrobium sp. DT211]|uniref:hypothetical protein n=1 Tax=Luteimicrobium sp. DT211 TaxID=3393412 RepID=UPI003CEE8295